MAKLNVAFLFDDTLDSNDGVSQYVKTVGAYLSSQGHEVSYLVGETKMREWSGGKVYSLARNLKVKFNGNYLSMPLLAKRQPIKDLLKTKQFDVVHVTAPYSPFMAKRVINNLPDSMALICQFHIAPLGWLPVVGGKLLRLLYGRSLRRVDTMLSVSSAAADYARQTMKVKTEISPNVVEIKRYKGHTKKTNQQQIVFLGRLVERKGVRQLLQAFNLVASHFADVQLVIAGDGSLRPELEKFVAANVLSDQVRFLGYIDEKDKPQILANADIACFPATGGESFGIVLIEAMAAGSKIVLGGNNPGYTTVLGAKPELLFDPNNTEAFAEKLREFLNPKTDHKELANWLKKEVERYDVEKVGADLIGYYEAAIAKRSAKQ